MDKPEPVAWTTDLEFDRDTEIIPAKIKGRLGTCMNDIPLYTAPPQSEWVELTKEECFELCVKHKDEPFSLLVAVQDKLKEKNG